MNFFEIINQLAEVDTDLTGRFDSRRAVFNSLGTVAKRTALAASPLFLGALFQKAYAGETGTKATSIEILNYALTLELLEQDFYAKVIAANLATGADATAIAQIKKHEDAHVTLLGGAINGLNGTPITGVAFSTTVFDNLTTFYGPAATSQMAYAQVLEDTGVRAYKGRAVELLGAELLSTALRIHSVEARHAAKIRMMRGQGQLQNHLPWVNSTDDLATNPAYANGVTGVPQTSYTFGAGMFTIPAYDTTKPSPLETNTIHAATTPTNGISAVRPNAGGSSYSAVNAAAAFDEPLQAAEVLDLTRAGGLVQ